jgi:hypothetical protein
MTIKLRKELLSLVGFGCSSLHFFSFIQYVDQIRANANLNLSFFRLTSRNFLHYLLYCISNPVFTSTHLKSGKPRQHMVQQLHATSGFGPKQSTINSFN